MHPNRGFTGGNNAIISETLRWPTPPDDFLLLNTDTLVALNALRVMHEFHLRRSSPWHRRSPVDLARRVAATAVLLPRSDDHRADAGCGSNGSSGLDVPKVADTQAAPPSDGASRLEDVRLHLVQAGDLEQIGLLDEGYFLYMDDPDFCFRARRAGWSVGHCDNCSVVHLKGGSNDVPASVRERRRLPRYYYVLRSALSRQRSASPVFGLPTCAGMQAE